MDPKDSSGIVDQSVEPSNSKSGTGPAPTPALAPRTELECDLSVLAQTHSVIRNQLEDAKNELAEKEAELKYETEKTRKLGAQVCIAEQRLRTLNENLYKVKEECAAYEKEFEGLIREKTLREYQLGQIQDEIDKKMIILQAIRKKQDDYKAEVMKQSASLEESDPIYIQLKERVRKLLEIKHKLETGDPEVTALRTGTALQALEAQKLAIHNGISEIELETDLLEGELEEREEALRKAEQAILIAEKQNQARIRKKQRFLEEQEATLNGLKTTALYLEKKSK